MMKPTYRYNAVSEEVVVRMEGEAGFYDIILPNFKRRHGDQVNAFKRLLQRRGREVTTEEESLALMDPKRHELQEELKAITKALKFLGRK